MVVEDRKVLSVGDETSYGIPVLMVEYIGFKTI